MDIWYKDGVYMVADSDSGENDFVVWSFNMHHCYYFGGRVEVGTHRCGFAVYLKVDGIPIVKVKDKGLDKLLLISEVVSHLNAMEANGVDAFLDNYKKSVEFAYNELKELSQKTESQLSSVSDESVLKTLYSQIEELQGTLFSLFGLLFSLYTFMSANLENEKVISVYQSVLDTIV